MWLRISPEGLCRQPFCQEELRRQLHSWSHWRGLGHVPRGRHHWAGWHSCDSVPKGCRAHMATLPASETYFTFFVLVFSGSQDLSSFSCLPADGGLPSMPSFPALPKKEQNKPNQQSAVAEKRGRQEKMNGIEHS